MPLCLRFIRNAPKPPSFGVVESEWAVWKRDYLIPLRLLILVAEVFVIFIYMLTVLVPSQMIAYNLRQCFTSIFFQDEHEAPIYNTTALNEYYQEIQDKAEQINEDFLLDVEFLDPEYLVKHEFVYADGSVEYKSHIEVDPMLLKNVVSIKTTISMKVYSSRNPVPGCILSTVVLIVSKNNSDPGFFLNSRFYRDHCPLGSERGEKTKLPYFIKTMQTIPILLYLLAIHLILDVHQVVVRSRRYKLWDATEPGFNALKGNVRLKLSIGWWLILEIVVLLLTILAAVFVLVDLKPMTEIPSLASLRVLAVSSVFHFGLLMQLFRVWPALYLFPALIREGGGLLMSVFVGYPAILCGFVIAGIFIFGLIAHQTRSVWIMIQIPLSFALGDNIEPTFNDFSNGTPLYNWMSFIYITLEVLLANWILFASFTAAILFTVQKIEMHEKKD